MRTQATKFKLILAVILAVLVIGVVAAVFFARSDSPDSEICTENVARLQQLEAADISATEKQLLDLKKQDKSKLQEGMVEDGALLSGIEIKQTFQGTAIIGDSITDSIVGYGFLDTDVVVAKLGLSVAAADEQISTVIGLHPSAIFMAFGANDLETYGSDANAFIDAYRVQVKKLQEALPDSPIYINGILPIQQSTIDQTPDLGYYPEYNQALEAFCDETGCTYMDLSFLVEGQDNLYEPDGEHVVMEYYPKWLTFMAKTAGL